MNTEKTILEVQSEIEIALQHLPGLAAQLPDALKPLVRLAPPQGEHAQVSLRHARTERQVKRNAPADSWSPDSGLVSISYRPSQPTGRCPCGGLCYNNDPYCSEECSRKPSTQPADTAHPDALTEPTQAEDPARDLVLALARAERDPQLGFVSLKWFRDAYLPQQGYAWAAAQESRQKVLVDAINRKWILTGKVANPKNPQYPVTAIRVNRPLAEMRKILDQEAGFGSAFAPITIPGERLSETVLRERR